MKKQLTFITTLFFLLYSHTINATNYYFSSSAGNDSYTSTQAQNPSTPWQSINKLNSFFSSLQPGDSVLFKCGDTFYGKLIANKSGISGKPIVLASYGYGDKPVISGFSSVASWTNIGNNLWESTNEITSSSNMLNMVTLNGSFQPIGRWPKFTDANQGYLNTDSHSGNTSITSSGLSGAPNFSGGQIVTRRNHWIIDVDNVNSNSGSTVNFSNSDPYYDIQTNWGFFFQNHRNACTQQGDWYYNTSSKKIGIYSYGTPSGVQVAATDLLVDLSGRSYITFKNISFTGSNNTSILLSQSQYITIDNCIISYAGQNAIVMTDSGLEESRTKNITIINSTIAYVNNNGIIQHKAKNCTITNNIIKNVGMVAGMGQNGDGQYIGVIRMGENSLFSNNIVDSIGYTAVWFVGQNINVRNNLIQNFCMIKDDGAGIYTYGNNNAGTVVSNNIVLNGIGNPFGVNNGSNYAEGIYMDDGSSNVEISGNSVANCSARGIYIHNSHEIQILNNTSYNNNAVQIHLAHDDISPSDPLRNINLRGNIFVARTSDQRVFRFSTIANDIQSFGVAENNYYARPINEPYTLQIPGTDNSLTDWQSFSGQDQNSKKSPKTISSVNDLRFEYNAGSSSKTITLGATYMGIDSKTYSGSVTLEPYSSIVLIYVSGSVSNQSPTANAGPDQNFFFPTNSTTLTGSGSDPDGSIASYQWSKISGPSQFNIVSPNQAQTVINNLVQGVYKFQLTVTDDKGATATSTVTITVNAAPNQPPSANAGPNQTITLPVNSITLVGSGNDPDGSISSYQWTKISGPSQFSIVSPSQAQTVINNLIEGTYQFQLKVTDNLGATATSTVTLTVNNNPNQPPVVNVSSDQNITLPANSVTLLGNGSDPDGTIASYQWTKISGPTQFTIVTPAEAETIINSLVKGTYQFQLKVTDNLGATATAIVTVIVNAAPNQLPTANAGANQNITLPTNNVTLTGSGSDPDGSISSYQWIKISGPSQFNISTPSQAQTTINNLVQGSYQFQLTVTDNEGGTGTDTVLVTVNAANQPPIANAGSNQSITLPIDSVFLTGSASDPDGSISSYSWTKISGPSQFTIVSPAQAQTSVSDLMQGTYRFQLTVRDNNGATATSTVTITVNAAPNQAPTANAGPDQNITLPTNSIQLSGSGNDPDGSITEYRWRKISGPNSGNIANNYSATTNVTGLVEGVYRYELRAKDNRGAYGRDTVEVTVNAANIPPIANAGPNKNITIPEDSTIVTGSANDQDGYIISYQWSKVSGPNNFNIVSPSQGTTVINNLEEGVYQFLLTVTDNSGATGSDIVIITVNSSSNQLPIADAGPNQNITLPIDSVMLLGSGNDADGNIVSYSWSQISGPSQFTIVSASQAQTLVKDLVEGTYQFELTVTDDNGDTGVDIVTIIVNSSQNQPPVSNAGPDQNITLPINFVTLTGSGSDSDGTVISYQWNKISGPSSFNIVASDQLETVIDSLEIGTYQFQLVVTDNSGATGTSVVTITVNPAPNQAPSANAGSDQTINLPTNSVSISGSGWDPDGNIVSYQWTKISGPDQYNIASPFEAITSINNLALGIYQFTLTVTDNLGATGTDTVTITINPKPNQSPTANAGTNQNITLPTNSVTLIGSGSDPDGTIVSYQWTKVSGPSQFNIVSSSQAQTVVNNLAQGNYRFQLQVTDNQGATATASVTITVNAAPNQPPTANAGPNQNITLPTNSVTLNGSGNDADGSIVFYQWSKISGPAQFYISNPSRAQTVINNLLQGTYQFQLRVTDNNGATATATVTVIVNPAPNQSPTANAGTNKNISLPTNSVTLSGSGNDPDGTIATYQWTKISGPSQFNIVSSSQAQTVINNLVQGTYQFQLRVTDNKGATATSNVTVTVNPAPNQPPTANAGTNQTITLPSNSVSLSGIGNDPDGTIVSYSWNQIAGPTQFSIVTPSQAKTTVNNLVQGVYVFQLTVTDNSGATGKSIVTITVNAAPPVLPPVANAGEDLSIVLPVNSVTLLGKGSTTNGSIVSYAWKQVSGPAQSSIVSPSYAQTSIINLESGSYLFELTVTDSKGLKGKDTVQVNVQNSPNREEVKGSVKLYPNPATDLINIDITGVTQKSFGYIKIYNALGNVVYQEEFVREQFNILKQINVSSFASGVYFVNITIDANNLATLKFIKM